MRKVKELLHHHHHADDNTTLNSGNTSYATTTNRTVADREIIGDKIDRSGTGEERLAKHTHIPVASTTTTTTAPLAVPLATTNRTVADREIIGDKIDRRGTGEERLSKHTHLPVTSTATTTSAVPLASTSELSSVKTVPLATSTVKSTSAAPIVPLETARTEKIVSAPIQHERVAKPTVVQERIIPVKKEEIQPVIYREREQLDVKQVTEKLHETKIQPTMVQQRTLAPEVKPAVVMRSAPIAPNVVAPSVQVEQTRSSTVVHQPIVQETIKKTVVEEVQPVLEREVVAPTLIKEVQPIYEKIVEAPRVFKEVLPTRELGVQQAPLGSQSSLTGKALNAEEKLKQFDNSSLNSQPSTLGNRFPSTH